MPITQGYQLNAKTVVTSSTELNSNILDANNFTRVLNSWENHFTINLIPLI